MKRAMETYLYQKYDFFMSSSHEDSGRLCGHLKINYNRMKPWIKKALQILEHSLGNIPQELNELDWKENLSPNSEKLCKHLSAFSNLPGGGYLVFGIDDATGKPIGINKTDTDEIVKKLSNL